MGPQKQHKEELERLFELFVMFIPKPDSIKEKLTYHELLKKGYEYLKEVEEYANYPKPTETKEV